MTREFESFTDNQGTAPSRRAHSPGPAQSSNRRRALNVIARWAVGIVRRCRADRDEFRNLLALQPTTLRDIGLDRPRAIAYPNIR